MDPHLILVGQVNAAFSLWPGVKGPVAGGRAGPVQVLAGGEAAGVSWKWKSPERFEVVAERWRHPRRILVVLQCDVWSWGCKLEIDINRKRF